MKNLWLVWLVLVALLSGCVKKTDRLARESADTTPVVDPVAIYQEAINAKKEDNVYRAIYLHKKNCDMGFGESCNRLGKFYYKGTFLTQDLTKAQSFFHRACKLGSKRGCQNEGNMLRLVSQDFPAAFAVYQDNCLNDHYESCYNIAMMYSEGRGVEQSYRRAKRYFKKACDGEIKRACQMHAEMLQE